MYHIGGAATSKYLNVYKVKFSNLRAKALLTFDLYYKRRNLLKALFYLSCSVTANSIITKQGEAIRANIAVAAWLVRNFKYVWQNRLQHWKDPKVSAEYLANKMTRLSVNFPLDLVPSKTSYQARLNEIVLYEKNVGLTKDG
jgi:hypothetical protein